MVTLSAHAFFPSTPSAPAKSETSCPYYPAGRPGVLDVGTRCGSPPKVPSLPPSLEKAPIFPSVRLSGCRDGIVGVGQVTCNP